MRQLGWLVLAMCLLGTGTPSRAGDAIQGRTWVAEDIDRRGVIDSLQSTIVIADSHAQGLAGCNRFTGPATLGPGDHLSFGALATTRMMCPPAVMDQERRFLDALGRTERYRMTNSLLEMLAADGSPVMRLSARP
jgi:putative lipoprotein